MERAQLLLVGLPILLLCTDIINLFALPSHDSSHNHKHHHQPPSVARETLEFPDQDSVGVGGIGLGSTVTIKFCSSCSYRETAVTMKKILETAFPGLDVILENYPAPLPKRLLGKLVPVVQMGIVGIAIAGEQIFPMLGLMTPPPWYFSLRANKFRTIASTWLLGNALQSYLQNTGAFEVFCNDKLVFSKLQAGRFPGEIELKDLVAKKLGTSGIAEDL